MKLMLAFAGVVAATLVAGCGKNEFLGPLSDTFTRSNFVEDCFALQKSYHLHFTSPRASMLDSLKAGTFGFSAAPAEIARFTYELDLPEVTDRNDAEIKMTSSECFSLAQKFAAGQPEVRAYKAMHEQSQFRLTTGRKFEYMVLLYDQKKQRGIMELGYAPIKQVDTKVAEPVGLAERANAGDAGAQYQLGLFYGERNRNFTAYNPKIAAGWLEKAAKQGHRDAQYKLALLQGQLGVQDHKTADEWITKAAEQGQPDAQCQLAMSLLQRRHEPKSSDEAKSLLLKAAASGSIQAMRDLADYNLQPESTVSWYERGAAAGDKYCADRIGDCYENGQGVPKNLEQAKHWYMVSNNQVRLAELAQLKGDFKESCRLARAAADAQHRSAESTLPFFPHASEAAYQTAQECEAKGDFEQATKLYVQCRQQRMSDVAEAASF